MVLFFVKVTLFIIKTYSNVFSAQDDVTYCWERGGVPPGINLSPTTDAKDKTSYGQVLIVGSVGGEGGSSPPPVLERIATVGYNTFLSR